MPSHPSVEGLREAVARRLFESGLWFGWVATHPMHGTSTSVARRDAVQIMDEAVTDYLREHGVLLGAEGLLREPERGNWPTAEPRLDALWDLARCRPIAIDISDYSDEYVAGFLEGQANIISSLPEPLTVLVPIPQDGECSGRGNCPECAPQDGES